MGKEISTQVDIHCLLADRKAGGKIMQSCGDLYSSKF